MRLRKEKAIVTIYDAVSILKGFNVVNGSLTQNYYAESATYVPNRYIIPLVLRPKIDVSDPNNVIENGDKVDELARLEWFYNGDKIISNDDFKIEGANLTIFKNSEEPFEISYKAEWFDTRKKQSITIEDTILVSCMSLAQSEFNARLSLDKPQNWLHNPLKNERIYKIRAYVSKDKVYDGAVAWYYVDSNKKDKLIDETCNFYVGGQNTNELSIDSSYLDSIIIKAKNIDNDKLKEIYWFFDKEGNPITYSEPEKTIIEGKDIFSLPESPITSKLDYRINGLTIKQIIKGGDFGVNLDKSEWVSNYSKLEFTSKNEAKLYNPTLSTIRLVYRFSINPDDKYYIKWESKSTIDCKVGIRGNNYDYDVTKTYKVYSEIFNYDTTQIQFIGDIKDTEEEFFIKNCILINLTQTFGKGNEPSKEWCDEHSPNYWEGIKSVQTPIRVTSDVGSKNLLPNGYIDNPEEEVVFLKGIKEGEEISVQVWGEEAEVYPYYDNGYAGAGLVFIKNGYGVKTFNARPYSINPEKNNGTVRISIVGDKIKVKVEKGKPTAWTKGVNDYNIPSTANHLYINNGMELKSVGEVKDYIENGKLHRNIQRFDKIGDLKWSYRQELSNGLHRYSSNLPIRYRSDKGGLIQLFCNNYPVVESIGGVVTLTDLGFGIYNSDDKIIYLTTKEKLDNPNSLFAEDTFIDFLLPETEVIDLSTSGNLTTYPNGTIFIDNAIQLEEQYQDGITIKEDYPIQLLESIKVGKEYLDTAKAVVKDNLITHPDIENGDNVTIEYIYDENPIRNTNSIAYLVLEDILDEFWLDNVYTYKITDGEWELVKVTDIKDYEEWLKTEKTSPYTLAPDGVIFGTYEAETKFLRQYPSSLYVDIIAPTRLKQGITKIKARVLVGTRDGVVENPSNYFHFVWYRKENQAGAVETIIGHGEEIEIDIKEKDMIGVELQALGVLSDTKTGDDRTLTDDENRKITLR